MIIIIISNTASGFYGNMIRAFRRTSYEVAFTHEGDFNSHNSHLWAQHNPHVTREWGHKVCWSINVRAGITGNCVAGPYLLSDCLNGPAYCVFCRKCYLKMCHWQFDATCGFYMMGCWRIFAHTPNSNSTQFPDRWLGLDSPASWPARSLDLNPLDFFLWGHLK
jgi:hypothetical protein